MNLATDESLDFFKLKEFSAEKNRPGPSIDGNTWESVPTRVEIGEKFGCYLIKRGNFLDPLTTIGLPVSMSSIWSIMIDYGKIANLLAPARCELYHSLLVPCYDHAKSNELGYMRVELERVAKKFPASFYLLDTDECREKGCWVEIQRCLMKDYVSAQDRKAFEVLKANDKAHEITTGIDNELPLANDIYNKLLNLKKMVDLSCRANGVFLINTDIEDLLCRYYGNEKGAITHIGNSPIVVSDRMDDTTTPSNGDVCAMYGDFESAGVVCECPYLSLTKMNSVLEGGFYTEGNFVIVIKKPGAYARLKVGE